MNAQVQTQVVRVIRQARVADLERLVPLGEMFYKEAGLPGSFNAESFVNNWTYFIQGNMGTILLLEENGTESKDIISGIGGVRFPEAASGRVQAQELFWFTHPDYRKQGAGEILLIEFERWAKEVQCQAVLMVALEGVSTGVEELYLQRGYKPLEKVFIKEV